MTSFDDADADADALPAPQAPVENRQDGGTRGGRTGEDTAPATAPAVLLQRVSLLTWAGIGALAALVGLLPWLATGLRLPLQNLWQAPTAPADMPRVLLPFNQYAITLLLAVVVTGYATAGLFARVLGRVAGLRWPRRAMLSLTAGVLGVHLLAAAQTASTVAAGLSARTASALYLAALLAVLAFAVGTGLLVLRLVLAASRPAVVIGVSLLAVIAASWLAALITPFGAAPGQPGPLASAASDAVLHWLPAVAVGAVIAWSGVHTLARLLAAAGGLALLWILPAAFTALASAASFRLLLPHPVELAEYGLQVFQAALLMPEPALPPLLLALVITTGGITARHLLTRRPAGARLRS
ncbi:hypothetical protein [Kineococcus arenarius]|uniref:hypothetical protein n=1 Tax=unclassified Kineococcus TaxID=2621656 RepID=UPI003D7EF5A8